MGGGVSPGHHRVNCIYCPLETTMMMLRGVGHKLKSEGVRCDFNQESVHPPNTAPWNHYRSNIYVELNVIDCSITNRHGYEDEGVER